MSLKNYIQELAQDIKVALGVGTATTSTGTATVLDWIPNDIGKLASLVGIALSVVLIYTHFRRSRLTDIEYKKTLLEIEILKAKEAERLAAQDSE